ncbi:hypothetical protein [Anoxybacillus kestanbolensis]|uniref:hypothetical protein n=1 Tax=Anoxybacillus kestanbolensis TaxID=227476 RepID=UPI003D2366C7
MALLPYTFEMRSVEPTGKPNFAIIKTKIENIKPEIINDKMSRKPHIGINGGFFAADNGYNNLPTGLRSISYWKGDNSYYEYNGTRNSQIKRKTFVSYVDKNNKTRATFMYARNLNEVLNVYPNAKAVIGGNDYNRESWGDDLIVIGYDFATWRTVLAWDDEYGYMIVTDGNSANIPSLKIYIENIGFDPVKSIVLDGSGSTSMRVVRNEKVYWYGSPSHDRYIGNMIRVYGIDWFE